MRRSILVVASAMALGVAMVAGPLGAAAVSSPLVYGCTPATYYFDKTYYVYMSIYNGSASTANLTHKLLAGNGTIVNPSYLVPITSTLPATQSKMIYWQAPMLSIPDMSDGMIPFSVRVVSNVPVVVSLSHRINLPETTSTDCMQLQP